MTAPINVLQLGPTLADGDSMSRNVAIINLALLQLGPTLADGDSSFAGVAGCILSGFN